MEMNLHTPFLTFGFSLDKVLVQCYEFLPVVH
jgi:hypothetical protein